MLRHLLAVAWAIDQHLARHEATTCHATSKAEPLARRWHISPYETIKPKHDAVEAEPHTVSRRNLSNHGVQLIRAVKRGEADALENFVEFHLPFLQAIATSISLRLDFEYEDVFQRTALELIKVLWVFDENADLQFREFAGSRVYRYSEDRVLAKRRLIQLPRNKLRANINLILEAEEFIQAGLAWYRNTEFVEKLRKSPLSWDDCCKYFATLDIQDFSETDVEEHGQSLDDGTSDRIDEEISEALIECLTAGLDLLPEREAQILRQRYGIGSHPMTYQEIADQLLVSRERVRQLQAIAEERLRYHFLRCGYRCPVGADAPKRPYQRIVSKQAAK